VHIAIGQTATGDIEFGEVYHAAALVAIDDGARVTVVGTPDEVARFAAFLNQIRSGSSDVRATRPLCAKKPQASSKEFERRRDEGLPPVVSAQMKRVLIGPTPDIAQPILKAFDGVPACLLWTRTGKYQPERNLTQDAFEQLRGILKSVGIRPLVIGSPGLVGIPEPNLVGFYDAGGLSLDPLAQLSFLSFLCDHLPLLGFSIGMKSGAMDGLAFARKLTTLYIARVADSTRMNRVHKAFPAFELLPVTYTRRFERFSEEERKCIRARVS